MESITLLILGIWFVIAIAVFVWSFLKKFVHGSLGKRVSIALLISIFWFISVPILTTIAVAWAILFITKKS